MEKATFTIGGKTYDVPEPPFMGMEAMWPHVREMGAADNRITQRRHQIRVFVAAFAAEENGAPIDEETIARTLRPAEYDGFGASIDRLLVISGYSTGQPSPGKTEATTTSTEVLKESSQN